MTGPFDQLSASLYGRYAIERELGRGGMATVWLATDLKHRRQVALKVLRPELAAVLGGERFLREITLTAGLSHPHILPLLDSGEAGGFLYYTMPFVAGESLRNRLNREKQLPVEEALRITREVADALDHAHRQGIIHRDIKPENILLESGHALVADFGIARAVSATDAQKLTETGLAIGTPGYMSPEQATATKEIDGRSDLYSLGCVMYEMLAGDPPYTGATPQAILARKLNEPLPRISIVRQAVPLALEEATAKALARVPADRYQTMAEFINAMTPEALAAFTPVTRPSRARRWVAPALAGAALVVVLALVLPRVLPRQTASPLDAPREPVLVVPFQVKAADPALADAGQRLATQITDAISQEGLGTVAAAGDETATTGAPLDLQRLARQRQAATLVTGTIYQHGDSVEVQARLLRAADLAPMAALPVERGAVREPARPLEGARRRVLGAVVWYLSPGMQGRDASLYRPPSSIEIFRLARRADETVWREGYVKDWDGTGVDGAAAQYLEAFRADTTNLGYAILRALHAMQPPLRDSLLAELERRRGELTRGEAFLLDYGVARYQSPDAQYRAAMAGYAADSNFWRRYAMTAAWLDNRPAEALRFYRERDSSPEIEGYARSKSLHQLGRFEEELALGGGSRLPALAAMGRKEALDSLIAASQSRAVIGPLIALMTAGVELSRHGHPDEGRRMLERGIAWATSQRFGTQADGAWLPQDVARINLLVLTYGHAGRYREAVEAGRSATAPMPQGLAAALRGDTAAAMRAVDSLLATRRRFERARPKEAPLHAARILAVLGQDERALAVLRLALNDGTRVPLFHHGPIEQWAPDFDELLGTLPGYQALIRRNDDVGQ